MAASCLTQAAISALAMALHVLFPRFKSCVFSEALATYQFPEKRKSLSAYQSVCPLFLIFHDFKILYLLMYYSKHKVKNHCFWDSKPVAAQGKAGSFPSLNGPRLQEKAWLGLRRTFLREQFLSLWFLCPSHPVHCCSVCLILRFHTSFSQ